MSNMTNIEILRKEAIKLLENGKLKGSNAVFVKQISKYTKKKLNELSTKQYNWLKDIVGVEELYTLMDETIHDLDSIDNEKLQNADDLEKED